MIKFRSAAYGFTLIELILFIVIMGILGSTILLSFVTALQKLPQTHQIYIADQAAQRCMEWILGQRKMNGLSSVACPSSTTPAFCTVPSGFTMSVNISCTTLSSDSTYETVTVTVGGAGSTTLSALLGAY